MKTKNSRLQLKKGKLKETNFLCLMILLSSDWDWDWEWDWESRIENPNSPSADSKISWATTHPPPTPQLLEQMEEADNKVPLVRMSQDDPLSPSSTKNNQVDSKNNNQGESNMIKE